MNARAGETEVLAPVTQQPSQALALYAKANDEASALITKAMDKNLDVTTLERLLAMRDGLRKEAAKGAFLDAMSHFQAVCPVIKKGKTAKIKSKREGGGDFEYKYAEIGAIVKVAAPLLAQFGLSFKIEVKYEQGPPPVQIVKCIVSHVLGHSEESEFRAPIDTTAVVNDMQKAASAASFGKRQAFCNAFGILTSDQDDDGRYGGARKETTDEPRADGDTREEYPSKEFLTSLRNWKELMESGQKTADDIIAVAESRYRLSDGQKQRIRSAAGTK